jgi:hypothetical protein
MDLPKRENLLEECPMPMSWGKGSARVKRTLATRVRLKRNSLSSAKESYPVGKETRSRKEKLTIIGCLSQPSPVPNRNQEPSRVREKESMSLVNVLGTCLNSLGVKKSPDEAKSGMRMEEVFWGRTQD